jgi:predicted DNA-binding protein with PD1-like motif
MEDLHTLEGIGRGRMESIIMGKLRIGVDLLEGIKELVQREGIRTGVILSATGALTKAIIRNLKILPENMKIHDQHRIYLDLEQPMEIVSLTGWIATMENGETEVHAHFSASTVMRDTVTTLGGHLTPGTITSVKVVVVIGVVEETNIRAEVDPRLNQVDVKLPL